MVQLSDMRWKVEFWNEHEKKWEAQRFVKFNYFDLHTAGNGWENEQKQLNKFIKLNVGQSLIQKVESDWYVERQRVTRVR